MKRITIFLILLLLASPAFGNFPADIVTNRSQMFQLGVFDPFLKWAISIDSQVVGSKGTGEIFYVDSGVTSEGDGSSWSEAKDTVEEGIALCLLNRGDIIYVAQGHAESFTAAAGLALGGFDADIAGISIIGMGQGDDRPTFTFADTDATVAVGAASVRFENLVFLAGISEVVAGVIVEAAGDNFTMVNCEFPEPLTTTFEFNIGIQLTAAANDVTIAYCTAYSADATGADHWINGGAGVVESLTIIGNVVYGEYAIAPIFCDQADLKTHVANNVVGNMTTGQKGIEFSGNATGWCYKNLVVTDTVAESYDTGVMDGGGGLWADEDSSDVYPVPWTTNETGVNRWGASELAQIEGEATDALEADHLDHLAAVSVADEIVDASFLADITTTASDWSDFVASTDSLQAISDKITALEGIGFRGTCEVNAGGAGFFTSLALGGFGNDFFNTGWYAIVTYDAGAAGAAPEGEVRDIVDYVSATGVFTIGPVTSAAITTNDKVMLVRVEDMNFDATATLGGSGRIMYVDAGVAGTADVGDLGDTWDLAYPTIAAALAGGTLSNGDVIYLAAGHTETIADAQLAWNIAGMSIIGIGEGDQQPTIIFNHANASIDVTAANIYVENVKFETSIDAVLIGIDIAGTGDGLHLKKCRFVADTATDEFNQAIVFKAAAADDVIIEGCEFYADTTATATEAIYSTVGASDNTQIIGNTFIGYWVVAPIWSNAAHTNALIKDNVVQNSETTQHCIELTAAWTGVIEGNKLYADTWGSVLDPGECACIENYATNAINTTAYLVPFNTDELVEYGPGRIFYVDSGTPGAGDGRSWATAVATLDAGVNLCTTLRGDTIYVAAGHTETVTTAFADLDLANITVIGLGEGKSRPYFDYTGASGKLIVNADNVTIRNLHMHANVDSVLIALSVETGSENVVIEDCLFTCESATDEFDVCIDHAAGNHGAVVKDCDFRMGAANAVSAVHFLSSHYAQITDNIASGDYSTAVLHNETNASDHILIRDNELFNGTITGGENTEPGIELLATTSGMIVNNNVVCLLDTAEQSIVALDCYLFGNRYNSLESSSAGRGIGLEMGKTYHVVVIGATIADHDLFDVVGGPILITHFIGEVTTVVGAAAATSTIVIDATSALDYEFSTAVDIQAFADGARIIFTNANPAVLTQLAIGANPGSSSLMSPWYCVPGMIEITDDDDSATTGAIDWHMTFMPLADGVTVTPQ